MNQNIKEMSKFKLVSKSYELNKDSLDWLKSIPSLNSLEKHGFNNSYQIRRRLSQTPQHFKKFITDCYKQYLDKTLPHDLAYHIELKEQRVYKNGNVIPKYFAGFEWNPTQELPPQSIKNHLFTIIWYQKFEVSGGKLKFKNISKLPLIKRLAFDRNPWSVYNNLNSNILGLNTIPVGTEGYQPKEKDLVVLGSKLRFKTENLQWNPLKNTSESQIKKVLCVYVCKV